MMAWIGSASENDDEGAAVAQSTQLVRTKRNGPEIATFSRTGKNELLATTLNHLELRNVSTVVPKSYRAKFREFLSYTGLSAEDCQNEVIGLNSANYFDAQILERRADLAEQTLARVAKMWPQLSENVGEQLPCASPCQRGSRKACGAMSAMQ